MKYLLVILALIIGTSAASIAVFYGVQQGFTDGAIMVSIVYGCYLVMVYRAYLDCKWWDDQKEGDS